MIDTVILTVPREKLFDIAGALPWELKDRRGGYEKWIKNPSTENKATGLKFPTLTGIKRKTGVKEWVSTVKIEFSVAKLLFLNNLDELEEKDFSKVIAILCERMQQMGVIVSKQVLENAEVSAIHYSRNISLLNGYTAQYAILELGKINLNKRFDLTKARYVNDGQSITIFSALHSFVIYDKIADLKKSSKRSIDRDQTSYQQSLFSELNKLQEVLRLEVRLSKKQKLNSVFMKLGFAKDPTFRDAFSLKKSQAVLKYYWDTMIKNNATALFAYSMTPNELLVQLFLARKTMKPKQAFALLGFMLAAKEGNGMRETRSIISKYSDDRTWYRFVAEYKGISRELAKLRPRDWLDQVEVQLREYKAFRINKGSIAL